MKFIFFVEGDTEKKSLPVFLKKWIDPKLSKPVGVKIVRFNGWRELVNDTPKKAMLYLTGPQKDDIVAVIALLDLYGPTIYPSDKKTAKERYEWARGDLEERVNHAKFRQFFAVHETESWLLSDPDLFPSEIRKAFPGRIQRPEEIDFDEPPAKLLGRLYQEKLKRTYKKTTDGYELFNKLAPYLAYNKCPRIKEFLDEMLKLAQECGL